VSASGEILAEGAMSQESILESIGEWSNPESLAEHLGDGWNYNYFGTPADAVAKAAEGPMGAMLKAFGYSAHMGVTSPLSVGRFLVQDPWAGGSVDEVTSEWIDQ
jgi:hypothetical protein